MLNSLLPQSLLVVFLSLTAFSATAEVRKFTDWALECPEGGAPCVLSQTIASADNVWLATVRMVLSAKGAVVQFLVPPTVHIASGLFASSDRADPLQATFIRCSPQACEAVLELDRQELDAWKRGNTAEVRYRPAANTPPAVFNISLMGLTAALRTAREASD